MKKTAIAFLLGMFALNAGFTPAAGAAQLLFDYVGFGYESPNGNPGVFADLGEGYVSVGEVPVLYAPLVFNTGANQYTYHLTAGPVTARFVNAGFVVAQFAGGTLNVYEDSNTLGTPFDYGVNPPNATAPPTFVDGTLYLQGQLSSFTFVLDTNSNSGSFEANYTVVGGSQLANIPVNKRSGWTFSGVTGNALNIPEGYAHQVDGQVFVDEVVPAQPTTWGALKANYR
jgi:hypothetical protein